MNNVRVWDVPTRLVHWLIVLLVAASWWSGETGRMEYHRYSGYLLLGLVAFRLYWGLFGASTARFRQFVRGPRVILSYLRGRWETSPGHNPLGALSAVVLLVLLCAQIVLGLFAVDVDGIESGPLSAHVSFAVGRACAKLHHQVFDVLLLVIGVHIAAVLFYVLVKKQNLIAAMFHGKREYPQDLPPVVNASKIRLIVGSLVIAALTWFITRD
ncbi:MAG: cytochrome b/b6 domain-containing protein [Pseudomonadota bacterium]